MVYLPEIEDPGINKNISYERAPFLDVYSCPCE
jgi:hypothetical protein